MNQSGSFKATDLVHHSLYGSGTALAQDGPTTIVRFAHGIESVITAELEAVSSLSDVAHSQEWDTPVNVLARIQAEAIQSLNDSWGVFSQSRVALLPHQLWVCQRVNGSWPARWIVADDVGLGKTIEAGLILSPLIANGRVRRLLVICPASIVSQWQQRMREMFDIRLSQYLPELDTNRSDFWNGHDQVVASLQTLRADNSDRHQRLLSSESWDMVVVDEAHHLNYDEHGGATLGYKLLRDLSEADKFESTVFFTGTPHRGKNLGFVALLELVRPDLFDMGRSFQEQLPNLREVMIRNNKQNVTDLKGERLFQKTNLISETYQYSGDEKYFYETLTNFIASGKAYATSMNVQDQRVAILVLITMQKLASSSIAAISSALNKRLHRILEIRRQIEELERQKRQLTRTGNEYESLEADSDTEGVSGLEEELLELSASLNLMEDEEPRIKILLEAADRVKEETKVERIISLLDDQFSNKSVLLFTEYKATQSMIMTELIARYGDNAVTFINGDEIARGVTNGAGQSVDLREDRDSASDRFNRGDVRFLVSTEAAGEGIDLQESCHSLIHVDLPWNPMRLHQRVGRLNRYGQTEQVSVVQLRNPDTVESRIWDLLNKKLNNISQAFEHVMEDPEDLMELILGMTSPSILREVFSEAGTEHPEGLNEWFDKKTTTFGGKDVIETVENIVGSVSRFDYQEVSDRLPKTDLPDLEPFVRMMVRLNNRRYRFEEDGTVGFNTPDIWTERVGVRKVYENLTYDRTTKGNDAAVRILGVGHKVVDAALRQAKDFNDSVTSLDPKIFPMPMTIFRISDKLTTESRMVKYIVVGVTVSEDGKIKTYNDEKLLLIANNAVNSLTMQSLEDRSRPRISDDSISEVISTHNRAIEELSQSLELPFTVPDIAPIAMLWPQE